MEAQTTASVCLRGINWCKVYSAAEDENGTSRYFSRILKQKSKIPDELQPAGHTISELEINLAFHRGFQRNFMVAAEAIRPTEPDYNIAESNLIIT